MNIDKFLTKEQKQQVNKAVIKAEKKTNAEIVPIITDSSGQYDRAEDVFGLILTIVSVCVLWIYTQQTSVGEWGKTQYQYSLPLIIATIIVAFAVGAFLASRIWFIRHLFTPRSEMKRCVARGAQRAFYEFELWKTSNSNAVLIYISLFERMVYVLGDKKIRKKFQDEDFVEVRNIIIENLRRNKRSEALCDGITKCGEKLKQHFPSNKSKKNQLEDHLRIFKQNL
ncbi:TPM domain-containing protein [Candidatus Uabimicrobium amorphum]|nr:TPM domain-containing protein [Candidatus Uabimicrobium amorphum]